MSKSSPVNDRGRSLRANVRTPSSQILNSSQKGGWYGNASSASNFGPDSISPTASNMLYSFVLLRLGAAMLDDERGEFVERVNASVNWREAHSATKTEDIIIIKGRSSATG
mmetsp:Transcript_20310/g.30464  ORF Transcript_20310/g.30464 Transcript_20310/m.30464 type:complete len:111 (-) Transcript_20310:70-402(-)